MTIEVQMLARRPKAPGEFYEKGVTYSLSDDLANVFIRNGVARRTALVSEVTDYPARLQASGKRYDVQDGLVDPVVVDAESGSVKAANNPDGWTPITNSVMRVRVTGPAKATITGRDKFGATQVLGAVNGDKSDVLYAEECIAYQVSVAAGTVVEIF